jgi:hypothetical protein
LDERIVFSPGDAVDARLFTDGHLDLHSALLGVVLNEQPRTVHGMTSPDSRRDTSPGNPKKAKSGKQN